jgi:hypothetical protein
MPPRSSLSRSHDDYASVRCPNCKHLVYASHKPGDPCLVNLLGGKVGCSCTEHVTPAEREAAQ